MISQPILMNSEKLNTFNIFSIELLRKIMQCFGRVAYVTKGVFGRLGRVRGTRNRFGSGHIDSVNYFPIISDIERTLKCGGVVGTAGYRRLRPGID
jgi:hypothetical protein